LSPKIEERKKPALILTFSPGEKECESMPA
jgi:hypothetical protein